MKDLVDEIFPPINPDKDYQADYMFNSYNFWKVNPYGYDEDF